MPTKKVSIKEESRINYTVDREIGSAMSDGDIQLGAILRIADATELMASNYIKLQNELEKYQRWYNDEKEVARSLEKSNSALRGHITRLRSKARAHCPGCNCEPI
jgi:IS1 family transposase